MIRRFYRAWLPLMVALIICDACPAAPIKVFLMGGQSNMRGRANVSGLPAALLAPQADVLICRGSQGTVGTTLEFLQPNNVALDGTTFGPDLTFGRTIADYFPAADFALLKYAVGGTALGATWKVGTGTTYLEFRQTVTNGLALLVAAGYQPEIVGMIWHQGENNIGNTQAKYESLLNEFIADMRLNYGANLPFMIGEIGLIQPGSQVIVDAQKAVAAADPYAVFVPASDLSFFDNYHFDRNGMVTLGERFAHYYQANFATLINGPGPDTIAPAPNPMSWATPPTAASNTSITMTATSASDSSGVQYFFDCTTAGGHDSAWQDSPTYTDTGLAPGSAYSYQVRARDKSVNNNETGFSTALAATTTTPDTTAPTPNPMSWGTPPTAASSTSITMTASSASDPSGVQYFFDCTTAGGHDSAWQDSPTYTDTGLTPSTSYSYQVMARDKSINNNETAFSTALAATTTAPDTTAPTPNPMSWGTPPTAASSTSITMTATSASDPSGVQYFFDCTTVGGHDSAWQDSPTYTDTGLAPGSAYSYQVMARDKSINNNETGFSIALAATTTAPDTTAPTPNPMSWGTPPTAASSTSITMTATSASDPSGVQYLFDCTTVGGHDSAWQDSPTYTDTGLAPSTSYSYQVRARDKSINNNETGFSTALAATTAAPDVPSLEVHEPFNFVAPDTTLSGNAGGTGLSGNWTTTSTTAVEAANLTYGSLSTSGSAIVASGYNGTTARVGIAPTALSGLLNDGGGLWMSFIYRYGSNATNTRFAIGLGDSYLSANGNLFDENAATAEQAIGFASVYGAANGDIPMIWDTNTYDGSNINGDPTFVTPPSTSPGLTSGSSSGYGFTPTNNTTYLVVLHAQWGADGSTNDRVTLYLPGTDLALGTAVTTYQAIVSQDSFDTLFFTADQTLGTLDEIRVGATYADVVPSSVVGSAFDTWATSGTATGVTFGGDANGDGVQDGMAFLLGADTPDDNATGLLQTASVGGGLVMNFTMLDPASSAPAVLSLSHSGDLGNSDPWSAPVAVPGTTSTVGGIDFVVSGSGTLSVEATIPATGNALDGKLFGRLVAEE